MGQPVVHFEIIGADPERLRDYYGELFGWDFDTSGGVAESCRVQKLGSLANSMFPVLGVDVLVWPRASDQLIASAIGAYI